MMKFFLKNNKQQGFTLVETLIAVSIFTVSVLGLMFVLSQGMSNINYVKQKMVATYLASEGVEYIRNMRDTFVVYDATNTQTGWNNFKTKLVSASCINASGCYFNNSVLDYTNHLQPMANLLTITACSTSCPILLYDNSVGTYNYTSGVNSGFVRKISISQISSDEIRVFSTVSWTQNSGVQSITFSESLFNWIE